MNVFTDKVVKVGFTKAGKQRFRCKACGKTGMENYSYRAYEVTLNDHIVRLTKEGMGIRSTARYLRISTNTLLRRIISIANELSIPQISTNKTYEVDEMRTYIKSKDRVVWIVCAYERESKRIVSFYTGHRTNKTLNVVLKTLQLANAKRIFTDGLRNYRYLIDKGIHRVKRFATNHIERFNLTLRTHLKRLNRRTICFSRSLLLLNAVLKIYLFA
ncbi:IS1 family transposase [Pedobacter frigiditerrae]|uniref:IS1 family transposase n=1 Tax=Pedobacter frigiditerrae TaxID=2530452 RepID=A0A4V2MHQ5_9SPHI|nr:IS1 family transposase [Pedobacter frigiditerrae]